MIGCPRMAYWHQGSGSLLGMMRLQGLCSYIASLSPLSHSGAHPQAQSKTPVVAAISSFAKYHRSHILAAQYTCTLVDGTCLAYGGGSTLAVADMYGRNET